MLTGPSRQDQVKLHHRVPFGLQRACRVQDSRGNAWDYKKWSLWGFRVRKVTETTKDDPAGHGSAWYDYCIRVYMVVCDTDITSWTSSSYVWVCYSFYGMAAGYTCSVGLVVRVTFHIDFEHLSIPVLLIDVELFIDILSRILELGLV